MYYRFLKVFFILASIVFILLPSVYAEDNEEIDYVWLKKEIEEAKNEKELNILSRNAVIYDRTSKTIIFGEGENDKVPMASTTKIMTAIVLLENANLEETVEVSKEAAWMRRLKTRNKNRR